MSANTGQTAGNAAEANLKVSAGADTGVDLAGNLRQMIAVLETERQALATLQPDALMEVTQAKQSLCDLLVAYDAQSIDPETRALVETAKSLNDVNRRVRNLLAANVAGRLDALGGKPAGRHAYTAAMVPG